MGRYSKEMVEKMRKACEVFSAALKIFDRTRDDSALRALVLLLGYHASVGRTVGDVAAAATTLQGGSVSARYVVETALAYMTEVVAGAVSHESESPQRLWRSIVATFGDRAALKTEKQLEAKRESAAARYASTKDEHTFCKKCLKNIRSHRFKNHDEHCGSGLSQRDAADVKAGRLPGTSKAKRACACAPRSANFTSR